MKKTTTFFFLILLLLLAGRLLAQNEASKWYFGNGAGLDFMTTPPTILTNGAVNTIEGCSAISDASGNLLFYTDGSTIYNRLHDTMFNGKDLFGSVSPCQSSIIIKKPGSTKLFYVFTMAGYAQAEGLNYSVVDITHASGNGSVIAKNVPLYNDSCVEKITAIRHCNGVDYWILIHDFRGSKFRAFRLTSEGVNAIPIISTIGNSLGGGVDNGIGCMKISPDGKKLGMTSLVVNTVTGTVNSSGYVDLFDFDPAMGMVSNWIPLMTNYPCYGCSFSPDGTKFYAGSLTYRNSSSIYQWDVCSTSTSAIAASQYSFAASQPYSMQQAPNGMIYIAMDSDTLGVIQNPNASGAACNYINNGQLITPKKTFRSLPNFVDSYFIASPSIISPFTYQTGDTPGCRGVTFISPIVPTQIIPGGCSPTTFSLSSLSWDFGDPASGVANTSTLTNPTHTFSSQSNYIVQLFLHTNCGTDTLKKTITVACVGISSLNPESSERVYPNPFSSEIYLDLPEPAKLQLYKASGELLLEKQLVKDENIIPASEFVTGIYILKLKSEHGVKISRLVKTE